MPIQLSCACGKKLRVRDELAGKKVKCPGCAEVLPVPRADEPEPVAAAEPEEQEAEAEAPPPKPAKKGGPKGFLAKNNFVVKEQAKLFSSRKAYDILDGDTGKPLGTAKQQVGWMASLLGAVVGKDKLPLTIEVRQKADDDLVFAVRRSGLLFKKVRVLDAKGQVVGRYKAKMLSLTGGFNVYDKDDEPFAEIKGKLLKADYRFVTPDGAEMGSVSKSWGGLAKELFTGAGTYGVRVEPEYAGDAAAKMLILGAAIAIDAMFGGKGGAGKSLVAAATDEDDEDDE